MSTSAEGPESEAELTEDALHRSYAERPATTLSDGSPVTEDHRELVQSGQQKGYVVLSVEERAKGFVRPVRQTYVHVGPPGPVGALRDLTSEEQERYRECAYVKFEAYAAERWRVLGRYWTQQQLDAVGRGCRAVTLMAISIAETFARDPKFYGGTFCCGCFKHLPIGEQGEFVWEHTSEKVGT